MRVEVLLEGMLGDRFVKERLTLDVPDGCTVREIARRVRRRTSVDLLALEGTGAVVMLDGARLDLPTDTERTVSAGALLAALSPLGGGSRLPP